MFVQLNGLENITLPAGISHFTLEVVFSEVWQSDLPVSASSLRLHCVPVINLFTLEADPLTISGLESEYLLRPKRLQDGHTEIYSVDSVTGSGRTGEARYRARCWIAESRYQPRRLPSAISVSPRCRPIPRRKTATTGGS